jgi:hypothetical protein
LALSWPSFDHRVPAGALGRADVSARATVRHTRWGIITYRAALNPVPDKQTAYLG